MGGDAYILHPLSVMMELDTDEERIVGVLHDVVEDGNISLDALRGLGFPEHLIRAIDGVTRREGESYKEFILRVKEDPISLKVKRVDLNKNSDLKRLKREPTKEDLRRVKKYQKALNELSNMGD